MSRIAELAERIVQAHGGYMVPPRRVEGRDNATRDLLRDAVVTVLQSDSVIASALALVDAHNEAVRAHDQADDDAYREAYAKLDKARKAVGDAALNEAIRRGRK